MKQFYLQSAIEIDQVMDISNHPQLSTQIQVPDRSQRKWTSSNSLNKQNKYPLKIIHSFTILQFQYYSLSQSFHLNRLNHLQYSLFQTILPSIDTIDS